MVLLYIPGYDKTLARGVGPMYNIHFNYTYTVSIVDFLSFSFHRNWSPAAVSKRRRKNWRNVGHLVSVSL